MGDLVNALNPQVTILLVVIYYLQQIKLPLKTILTAILQAFISGYFVLSIPEKWMKKKET